MINIQDLLQIFKQYLTCLLEGYSVGVSLEDMDTIIKKYATCNSRDRP